MLSPLAICNVVAAILGVTSALELTNQMKNSGPGELKVQQEYGADHGYGRGHGHGCDHGSNMINLLPDVGFYPFTFGKGNRGLLADQSFFFSNSNFNGVRVTITDCFCSGDSFFAIVNNNLGYSFPVLNECQPDPLCRTYSEDPFYCMVAENAWCSNSGDFFAPGYHNVSIQTATSPFGQGTGFIMLQTLCFVPYDEKDCGADKNAEDCGYFIPCCELDCNCVYSVYQ